MKTVVVTGATSGIGYAVCAALLNNGYRVIGLGHSAENCTAARRRLLEINPAFEITYHFGDLMQQPEVRRLAGEISQDLEKSGDTLQALVLNAGCVRSWYMTTGEGYEQQFALNHLSGFLLTHELLGKLLEGGGRLLLTSSGSHKLMRVNWQDIMYQKRYRPLMAYKQSKLCNMLFAYALAERFAGSGLRAYGVDPGLVATEIGCKNTGRLVAFVWKRRKKHGVKPEIPAQVYLELISRETAPCGLYVGVTGEKAYSREVTKKNADRLFNLSEELCQIRFGVSDVCS